MADIISKVLNDPDNKKLIETFFGNLDDIKVTNKSEEYMQKVNFFQKQRDDQTRYEGIKKKLAVPLNDDEYYNSSEVMNLNDENDPTLQGTNAYKQFSDFRKNQESLAPEQQSKVTFAEYVGQNPALKDELTKAGLITKNQTLKSEDELKNTIYEKGGLTDEEKEFHKSYQPLEKNQFNRNLADVMLNAKNDLVSKGRKGSTMADLISGKIKNLAMDDKEDTKYDVTVDKESGNILFVNPKDPTDVKIQPYSQSNKKSDNQKTYDKIGYRIREVDDGAGNKKYVYEVPTDEGWKELPVEATPESYEAYRQQVEDKGMGFDDKQQSRYNFKVSTGSTGNKKGSKKTGDAYKFNGKKLSDLTPDEMKKIPIEDIKGMEVGDLNSLDNYKESLTSDQRKAINDARRNTTTSNTQKTMTDIDKVPDAMKNTSKYKPKNTDEAINKAQTLVNQTKLAKAITSFQSFIEDDKWSYMDANNEKKGNYNIPPEEWARELSYQPFYQELLKSKDQDLIGVLEDWFKRKTGRNLEDF